MKTCNDWIILALTKSSSWCQQQAVLLSFCRKAHSRFPWFFGQGHLYERHSRRKRCVVLVHETPTTTEPQSEKLNKHEIGTPAMRPWKWAPTLSWLSSSPCSSVNKVGAVDQTTAAIRGLNKHDIGREGARYPWNWASPTFAWLSGQAMQGQAGGDAGARQGRKEVGGGSQGRTDA